MTTSAINAVGPRSDDHPATLFLTGHFGAADALDLVVAMRTTIVDGHLVLDVSAVPRFDVESLAAILRGVRSIHQDGGVVTVEGARWAQFLDLFMAVPLGELPSWVAEVRDLPHSRSAPFDRTGA